MKITGTALGKSINMVFARLAKRHLDPDDLRRMAGTLGFSGAADPVLFLDRDGVGASLYGRGSDIE